MDADNEHNASVPDDVLDEVCDHLRLRSEMDANAYNIMS